MSPRLTATVTIACLATASTAYSQWVTFNEETDLRIPAAQNDPSLTTDDDEEKDYAWGDLDQDGDIDLVIVRKQPFTSTGKRVNVLLMNEGVADGQQVNGVLVDRTAEYATASDVPGDQGFNTPTNDRDVVIVDVNGDGWDDLVTCTTLTDNQAKHLSHPRVYMNLGNDGGGNWQGFEYQDARIPQMHPTAGPRFCSVAAGDIDNDGDMDLYFGDYDSGGGQILDYNNKLLINDGNGFFTDESNARLDNEMRLSAFGAASIIADMNNDGAMDVVKQTALNPPQHIAVTYNDDNNPGFFESYQIVNQNAPYFVSVGDLNNDGNLDLVAVDDGTDTYHLSNGPGSGGGGQVTFQQASFSDSGGFGGNSLIVDLNGDGWNDVIITDVDVDIPGCSRDTFFYRNDGNGPNVTFTKDAPIPASSLDGIHDIAVFDLNGDGALDMIVGRCNGTELYMNDPPLGIDFSYPDGRPALLNPNEPTDLLVSVDPVGGQVVASSMKLFVAVDGGSYSESGMVDMGGGEFMATIPGVDCLSEVSYYIEGALDGGAVFTDPPGVPFAVYGALAATGTELMLEDKLEGDVSGWTTGSAGGTSSGFWENDVPNGTIDGGVLAAPSEDGSTDGVRAFVTDNGAPGEQAGTSDVDGGPVWVDSPTFDLAGSAGVVTFKRWFYCSSSDDSFQVFISNDNGASWTPVSDANTGGTDGAWEEVSFSTLDYIASTSQMKVRFMTSDNPNDSITEAGVDDFQVDVIVCAGAPCATDLDGSGATDFNDLVAVLAAWGPCDGACDADFDSNGSVDFNDLVTVLAAWGPCK